MTQTQLVRSLAENCEMNNKSRASSWTVFPAWQSAEVKKNGVFVLPGIGRLVRVDRKARMGRNPATGESIKIPAKKVVKFRVAKAAKDAIVRRKRSRPRPAGSPEKQKPRGALGGRGVFCFIESKPR